MRCRLEGLELELGLEREMIGQTHAGLAMGVHACLGNGPLPQGCRGFADAIPVEGENIIESFQRSGGGVGQARVARVRLAENVAGLSEGCQQIVVCGGIR